MRRHLRKQPRIEREATQMISRDHLRLAADAQHRRIVARGGAHVGAQGRCQPRQCALQRAGADLGTAAGAGGLTGRCCRCTDRGVVRRRRGGHARQRCEPVHELAVDPVLPAPDPVAFGTGPPFLRQRPLAAQRDQPQEIPLRPERTPLPPREIGPQVPGQNRRRPDRVDARLGARGMAQVGAVAGGEDARVAGAAQLRIDNDIAVPQLQPGLGQPALRLGTGGADGQVALHGAPAGKPQPASLDRLDRDSGLHFDAIVPHLRENALPRARSQLVQNLRPGFEDGDRDVGNAGAPQAVGHRQRQFAARHAAADDRDPRCRRRRRDEGLPDGGEALERLGGQAVLGEAGDVQIAGDADIKRQQVITQRRAAREMHLAPVPVEPRRPVQNQPRPGEAGQADQVDLQLFARVVTRDMARQHAGIGRRGAGIDQRDPQPRHRAHPEAAQHQRMGMAAADQHQVPGQGDWVLHRCTLRYVSPPWSYPSGWRKARGEWRRAA